MKGNKVKGIIPCLSAAVIVSITPIASVAGQPFSTQLNKELYNYIKTAETEKRLAKMPKVSFIFVNKPIASVMNDIAGIIGYSVAFEDGVDLNTRVTARIVNMPINEALDTILKPIGYMYSLDNLKKLIVVKAFKTVMIKLPPDIIEDFSANYNYSSTGETETDEGSNGGGGNGGGGGSGGSSSTSSTQATSTMSSTERLSGRGIESSFVSQVKAILSKSGTVSLDPSTGILYIRDYPKYVAQAEKFVKKWIKQFDKQVLVEAYVIDLGLSNSNQIGIDWGLIRKYLSGNRVWHITQTLPAITNPSISASLTAKSPYTDEYTFNLFLHALESQGRVRVVSEPRILIQNNTIGYIQAGDSVPYISNIQNNYQGEDQMEISYQTSRVIEGVSMSIVPHIINDNQIELTISPTLSNIKGWNTFTIDGNTVSNPIVTTRSLYTKLFIRNGGFLVIGGATTDTSNVQHVKVPLLGDIPIIGKLFTYENRNKQRSQMIILLRVKIVKGRERRKLEEEAIDSSNAVTIQK